MIRILISAILYFITMFTQAQESKTDIQDWKNAKTRASVEHFEYEDYRIPSKVNRFHKAKFEVKDKDVTFEIRIKY